MAAVDREYTPAGKFTFLLGLAGLAAGLYVGFGMEVASVGVDGSSLDDLAGAHPVSCGTAFRPDWQSVSCDQALSGRKTTAIVLLVAGGAVTVGAFYLTKDPTEPTRACPMCRTMISADARVCPQCGRDVYEQVAAREPEAG